MRDIASHRSTEYSGRKIADLFADVRKQGALPVGVLRPSDESSTEWLSDINPSEQETITLPLKVVCIVKDNYSEKK